MSYPPTKGSFAVNGDAILSLGIAPTQGGKSASTSKSTFSTTERNKKLLDALDSLDSLYLCPIYTRFPNGIGRGVDRKTVYRYEIKDYHGATRFYAAETTSRCKHCLCSNSRSFQIRMYEPSGELVFESFRAGTVSLCITGGDSCCGCMTIQKTLANRPNEEHYIGRVISESGCATPIYRVENVFSMEKYHIVGPSWSLIFPWKIRYGYDGLQDDRIPNPKTVGVIFPPRCGPETKACLLAAGFMLDVTYFQRRGCTCFRLVHSSMFLIFIILIVVICLYLFLYTDML